MIEPTDLTTRGFEKMHEPGGPAYTRGTIAVKLHPVTRLTEIFHDGYPWAEFRMAAPAAVILAALDAALQLEDA